jgi:O-antigen/teichoic acid export membrane protein
MAAENTALHTDHPDAPHHRAKFFRQSGWLMIANVAGGALMWAVHFLAKAIPKPEYAVFGAMLAMVMCVPAIPLQMVFTHLTAQALATHRERELAGMIRMVWAGLTGLWLVAFIVVFLFQDALLVRWQVANPAALWVTLGVILLSLWVPLFWGVLQGQQNFLWFGFSMIASGVGRFGGAALLVLGFGCYAAGMMTGALLGLVAALGVGVWQTRRLWSGHALPFDWRKLLSQVIPLMLGFGAFQFLLTADTMFVKSYFPGDDTAPYVGAGTMSRALMWLVGPLATVMFPKLVHSAAKGEKSNLMGMVLLGTAVLAAGGVGGLMVLGPWVTRLVYNQSYVEIATTVLPWYAGAMVPLTLANVLLSNLLAHSQFRVVPALVVLAAAYAYALTRFHGSFVMVLQVFGISNLLLLALCAWFTWRSPESRNPLPDSAN